MLNEQQRNAMYENEIARLYEWKDDAQKDVFHLKGKIKELEVKFEDTLREKESLTLEYENRIDSLKNVQMEEKKSMGTVITRKNRRIEMLRQALKTVLEEVEKTEADVLAIINQKSFSYGEVEKVYNDLNKVLKDSVSIKEKNTENDTAPKQHITDNSK